MKKKVAISVAAAVLAAAAIFFLSRMIISRRPAGAPPVSESGRAATPSPSTEVKALPAKADDESTIKDLRAIIARSPESKDAESAYLLLGSIYYRKGDLKRAKDAYQQVIDRFPNSNNVTKAQALIDGININLLFSPTETPDSSMYVVQKGDSLSKLARQFGTTIELIAKTNGIKGTTLKIGQRLKISKARFAIVVDKSQNILTLKSGRDVVKTYPVSTGKDSVTPVGTFKIINRIVDPPWYPSAGGVIQPGDPRNVLGSRWLGISMQGYGIHGTTEPSSIGRSVTEGCVRMNNRDVEELYTIVPEGTEVMIVD